MTEHARTGRRHRTWPQRLLLTFNIVLVLASLATAAGLAYLHRQVGDIPRVRLGAVLSQEEVAPGEPQNFLFVGTDSAEGLDPDDPVVIGRPTTLSSDTIMILRVDPDQERAALLSLPRDLWLPIAGTGGSQRINTAIQGGPQRLIATVVDAFNIPIHHYVAINFLGFRELVETVDGVPVYFADPVRDRKSGLEISEPGCVTLDPVQALAYARSRAYEAFRGGRWRVDGSGDLGRISRQQDFIRRALRRAVDKGARNPIVANDLIEAGIESVTIDDELSAADLIDLGARFRGFNPDTLDMYSVPVFDDVIAGASVLRLSQVDAQPVLGIFRGAEGGLTPATVPVSVRNGTGAAGLAAGVADDLTEAGFTVPADDLGDAQTFAVERTVVRYGQGQEAAAALVASYLEAEPVLEPDDGLAGVVLVAGADYEGVRDEPRAVADGQIDARTTTTASPEETGGPGATTSSTGPGTTTTVPVGEVSTPPPGVNC